MNPWQSMLEDFHRDVMADPPSPPRPMLLDERAALLRLELIYEETIELQRALLDGNMVEIADGMADLIYVVLGTAVRMGIDLEPVMEEVHATNMAKAEGPMREDGKRLKPEGWTPPDIAAVLRAQGWVG